MPLSIKAKPAGNREVLIGNRSASMIEIADMETGVDLTNDIRSIVINFPSDDIATATIEIFVGELEIDGVKVVKEDSIKADINKITLKQGDLLLVQPKENYSFNALEDTKRLKKEIKAVLKETGLDNKVIFATGLDMAAINRSDSEKEHNEECPNCLTVFPYNKSYKELTIFCPSCGHNFYIAEREKEKRNGR